MQSPEVDKLKPITEEIGVEEGISSTDNIVPPRSGELEPSREGHKQESVRRAARKQDERDF